MWTKSVIFINESKFIFYQMESKFYILYNICRIYTIKCYLLWQVVTFHQVLTFKISSFLFIYLNWMHNSVLYLLLYSVSSFLTFIQLFIYTCGSPVFNFFLKNLLKRHSKPFLVKNVLLWLNEFCCVKEPLVYLKIYTYTYTYNYASLTLWCNHSRSSFIKRLWIVNDIFILILFNQRVVTWSNMTN